MADWRCTSLKAFSDVSADVYAIHCVILEVLLDFLGHTHRGVSRMLGFACRCSNFCAIGGHGHFCKDFSENCGDRNGMNGCGQGALYKGTMRNALSKSSPSCPSVPVE